MIALVVGLVLAGSLGLVGFLVWHSLQPGSPGLGEGPAPDEAWERPPLPSAPSLVLAPSQAEAFLGALVAVCRADGHVSPLELQALREVASRHGLPLDEASLTFTDHDPEALEGALRAVVDAPFRASATSPPREIADRLMESARWVATADGPTSDEEDAILARFQGLLKQVR